MARGGQGPRKDILRKEGIPTMKKSVPAVILLLLLLPTLCDASYLIRLKNGGEVATSFYWVEGRFLFFRYAGGTAGVERRMVDRVQSIDDSQKKDDGTVLWNPGLPPEPPPPKKVQQAEKPKEAPSAVKEEPVDIESYKKKKDQLNAELERLLEQQRQMAVSTDDNAKRKIQEGVVAVSKEIYALTDEVTKKNKGKLPEGWWGDK